MPKQSKTPSIKSQVSATKKLIAQSKKQANSDLVNQWRFLRKIGAYQTKETAAAVRLTDSRIRAIKAKMREVNSLKKYVRGHTVRPVKLVSYKTPSGKVKVKYDFHPSFTAVRTKNKPIIEEGIKKVGKGSYIVETTSLGSKVSINKKGEVVEVKGKTRRVRTRYKGRDLIKLLDKFDKGKYKFKKHDVIVFHRWGHPTSSIAYDTEAARLLSNYVNDMRAQMTPDTFDRFLSASYVEIISEREINDGEET